MLTTVCGEVRSGRGERVTQFSGWAGTFSEKTRRGPAIKRCAGRQALVENMRVTNIGTLGPLM